MLDILEDDIIPANITQEEIKMFSKMGLTDIQALEAYRYRNKRYDFILRDLVPHIRKYYRDIHPDLMAYRNRRGMIMSAQSFKVLKDYEEKVNEPT